jgi:hypothetical protein
MEWAGVSTEWAGVSTEWNWERGLLETGSEGGGVLGARPDGNGR